MKAYAVRVQRTVAGLLILATVVCVAGPAHADTAGVTGTLVGIVLKELSSTENFNHRGKIVVEEAGPILREYRWMGAPCSGKNVSDNNVNILARVVGKRTVQITPYYRPGVGGVRCLVSFLLADPEVIEDIDQ